MRNAYRGQVDIVGHLAQQVLVDEATAEMPGFSGCQAGVAQGCISATGDVYPCVLLPIPVGNLRRASLTEIWRRAPLLNELRDRNNLGGSCNDCHVRKSCGGCRAVAYARTGDVFASDPRCWIAGPGAAFKETPLTITIKGAAHV
ncbi:MAG: SPASM domain-containing protein [Acidimicrobiia bacterium]